MSKLVNGHIEWNYSDGFSGDLDFCSNFFPSPIVYPFQGVPFSYPTVEHGYQAAKGRDMHDHNLVSESANPGTAKYRGKNRILMRDDWEQVKDQIMMDLVTLKFSMNPELGLRLLNTGDCDLIEYNSWGDRYWGMVKGPGGVFVGRNQLGLTLMAVRHTLSKNFRKSISRREAHLFSESAPTKGGHE